MADIVNCPKCGTGTIKGGFKTIRIVFAILLFPIGLLFLIGAKKPSTCLSCGTSW